MKYNPDRWMLLEIESPEGKKFLKVFATCAGGYTGGDSWRINSGVDKVVDNEDKWDFIGASGSCYSCFKGGYGVAGAYNYGVLDSFKKQVGDRLKILSEEEAINTIKDMLDDA